jgi:hypothetical protein
MMLTISPSNDKEVLNNLSKSIFNSNFEGNVGYILTLGNVPIGIAKINCSQKISSLSQIGILQEYRKQKYGDFFARSILLRLSTVSDKIEIYCINDYFKKFGFIEKKGKLVVSSNDLVFPSECKKGV